MSANEIVAPGNKSAMGAVEVLGDFLMLSPFGLLFLFHLLGHRLHLLIDFLKLRFGKTFFSFLANPAKADAQLFRRIDKRL
jgi:hypothetical protein